MSLSQHRARWLSLLLLALLVALGGVADAQPRGGGSARPQRQVDTTSARGQTETRRAPQRQRRGLAGLRRQADPPDRRRADVTRDFRNRYESARRGSDVLPASARDHSYLLVGGFWGQEIPGYLKPNVKRLRARGLEARIARTNTRASVDRNIEPLVAEIEALAASGKKVVLIAHSMGGLVAVETLAHHPELKQKIGGLITIGTPYHGVETPARGVAGRALKLARTDPKILEDVSAAGRQRFIDAHGHPEGVPILSVSSSRMSVRSGAGALSAMQRTLKGVVSDGIVPTASQRIPGSHGIELKNMDHFESVRSMGPLGNYRPGPLTEALVATLLSLER